MPINVTRVQQIAQRARTGREVTIAFGNQTGKKGLKGGVTKLTEWQVQGYAARYEFSVWIAANTFTPPPETDDKITVDTVSRRVLGVHPDSVGALIRLDLGGVYAGS